MENSVENTQPTGNTQSTGKVVSAAAILAALQSGKTRKEIKAEFGLTHSQMKQVFDTPGLKGKRTLVTRRPEVFQVINDLPVAAAPAPVVEDSATNAVNSPTDEGSDLANNADLLEAGAPDEQEDIIDASAVQEEEEQDDRPPFERFS